MLEDVEYMDINQEEIIKFGSNIEEQLFYDDIHIYEFDVIYAYDDINIYEFDVI